MKRAWLALVIAAGTACSARVDLATTVQVEQITTGWIDAGVVAGKRKIVPAATFTMKNVSDQGLGPVHVNAVFRQVTDQREWSSAYVPRAATELGPGASTGTITTKGENGYTSEDAPEAMLNHSQFVDAKVDVFVRSGSPTWEKMGEYSIDRRLVAPARSN